MSAHTKGPWTLGESAQGGAILLRGKPMGPGSHPQSHLQIVPIEDASLIAAAPEMYEALGWCLADMVTIKARLTEPYRSIFERTITAVRVVLAKIDGDTT